MAGARVLSCEMRALPYRFNEPFGVEPPRPRLEAVRTVNIAGPTSGLSLPDSFWRQPVRDHERGLGLPRRPPGGPGWEVRPNCILDRHRWIIAPGGSAGTRHEAETIPSRQRSFSFNPLWDMTSKPAEC